MDNGQQKQTKQSLQVKFAQYLGKYKNGFTIPEYKFLRDMCLGILKSQSVICLFLRFIVFHDQNTEDHYFRFFIFKSFLQ